MSPLQAIRAAHKASGFTVTELANATGTNRARLGQWLAQGRPDAIPGKAMYGPPTDAQVRLIVDVAVGAARRNLQAVSELRDTLPKPG
jgi:hypothetical protein